MCDDEQDVKYISQTNLHARTAWTESLVSQARRAERKFGRREKTLTSSYHNDFLFRLLIYEKHEHEYVGGKVRKMTEIMSSRLALPCQRSSAQRTVIHSGSGNVFGVAFTSTLTWQKWEKEKSTGDRQSPEVCDARGGKRSK